MAEQLTRDEVASQLGRLWLNFEMGREDNLIPVIPEERSLEQLVTVEPLVIPAPAWEWPQ